MVGTVERVGEGRAVFSADGLYRYRLSRIWSNHGGLARLACWILLNPSTADQDVLDPTLRRGLGFTKALGLDGMLVVNLFGLRSTDPRALLAASDPVGPENDEFIQGAVNESELVVLGWGAHEAVRRTGRDLTITAMIRRRGDRTMYCLGRTADGSPRHPLYLRSDAKLVEYATEQEAGR